MPIITTPCFGTNEQVLFGLNAQAVSFGDFKILALLIESLLENEDKRKQMGRNSRLIFETMQNKAEMIQKYERLIYSAFQVGLLKENEED